MKSIRNAAFTLQVNDRGYVDTLVMNEDPDKMNWVVDPIYLQQVGYNDDEDKLFGQFRIRINGQTYESVSSSATWKQAEHEEKITARYEYDGFGIEVVYDLMSDHDSMSWRINLHNGSGKAMNVESFQVWTALAYIMFKDHDVNRNIGHSCAVFPSISNDFTKLACVRRSGCGPHLGIYSVKRATRSVGTYCRFVNDFFKNVSPSLDGILFHNLILAGKGTEDPRASADDWIYFDEEAGLILQPGESAEWGYSFKPFADQRQFNENGITLGHPVMDYTPAAVVNGRYNASFRLPVDRSLRSVWVKSNDLGVTYHTDVTDLVERTEDQFKITLAFDRLGERKLGIEMDNGKTDFVVFNVMEPVKEVIEARVDHICSKLYQDDDSATPHAFLPLSNQGESLGKVNLVLLKNLMGSLDLEQLNKAENCAYHYIKMKWFEHGDFDRPVKLYGNHDFYRIIDFDYIAHVFYLLSRFQDSQLTHAGSSEYLHWAAKVMIVRLDENLHEDEREKKETQMLGTYILFINDLLQALYEYGMEELHRQLNGLWTEAGERIRQESAAYKGAVTEHFYDNAGFGPSCEALCLLNLTNEAERYGKLLLANIGFSNDFRAQNPDRWWESLSYMIHSLWGGLVSASALVAYEHLRDPAYLEAAYRGTIPVFYCYDWHATATAKKLQKGEAASTYSVAGPNLNRPDLSRNRFGQAAFAQDGGLFADLFGNASGDDWDMGEELTAYLAGFGSKTFLYYKGGELKCVNGEIIKRDDYYEVASHAAYPREFHFFEEQASYLVSPGETSHVVGYKDGTFFPVR